MHDRHRKWVDHNGSESPVARTYGIPNSFGGPIFRFEIPVYTSNPGSVFHQLFDDLRSSMRVRVLAEYPRGELCPEDMHHSPQWFRVET